MLAQGEWTGWKSGRDVPVMELALNPYDLSERYGLEFTREEDEQLGPFSATHFFDEELGPVAIFAYDQSPSKTATVFVDSWTDVHQAVKRLYQVLGLASADVLVDANHTVGHRRLAALGSLLGRLFTTSVAVESRSTAKSRARNV